MRLDAALLGGFQLWIDDEPVTAIHQPRLQSLLAHLLLNHAAPQSRQRLAASFWPDQRDASARNNLRAMLHKLRRLWPQADRVLEITSAAVGWRAEVEIYLDVDRFLARFAAAQLLAQPAARAVKVRQALDEYGGPLLPDHDDVWIFDARQALEESFTDALALLIDDLETLRDYADAIQSARRLLARQPWRESTYRSLMRMLALTGQRAEALHLYQQCVDALREELAVEPDQATISLYERLATGAGLEADGGRRPKTDPLLIGRHTEWHTLQEAWTATCEDGARALLLSGEPGIGKTHLAQAFLEWADLQGYVVAHAPCFAAAGATAYAPLIEWLRRPAVSAQIDGVPRQLQPFLAQLIPTTPHKEKGQAPAPHVSVDELDLRRQRHLLFEALAEALAPRDAPRIYLLDDVQWCDQDSLNWLQYLLNQRAVAPVLLLLTLRAGDAALNKAFELWRMEAASRRQLTEVRLSRLSATETRRLAQAVSKQTLSADHLAALFQTTAGNPLFVVESLREMDDGTRLGKGQFPAAVQALVRARLATLSEAGQRTVEIVAVIGRAFDEALVLAASELEALPTLQALEELWRRRVIYELDEGGFAFSHGLVNEIAYAQLNPLRKRSLHRRVGEALISLHAHNREQIYGEAARHFAQAHSYSRALTFYTRAAEAAQRVYAYHRAAEFFSQAVEIAQLMNVEGERLTKLFLRLGRMLEHGGRYEEALAAYRRLEQFARVRQNRRMEGVAVERLVTCYTEPTSVHDWRLAQPLLARGLVLAQQLGDDDLEVRLLRTKMVGASHYGEDEAGRAAGLAAIEIAHKKADREQFAYLANDLAIHLRLSGFAEEGDSLADEARAIFAQQNNLSMLADNLSQQALFDLHRLALASTDAFSQQCETLCRQIDNGWNLSIVLLTRATRSMLRGDFGAAIALYRESHAIGEEADLTLAKTMTPSQLGALLRMLGQPDAACALHEEARTAAEARAPFLLAGVEAQLALDAVAVGDSATAQHWLEAARAHEATGVIGRAWLTLADLPLATVAAATGTGEWHRAATVVDAARAEARRRQLPIYFPRLELARGLCYLNRRTHEQAVVALCTAYELAESAEQQPVFWRALAVLAKSCQEHGETVVELAPYRRAAVAIRQAAESLNDAEMRASFLAQSHIDAVLTMAEG